MVAVILIAATAIFHVNGTESCLVVRSGNTGEAIARYPLFESGEFSVGFKHSVNQSLVEDRYRIVDGEIMVYETLYYHFGAGVQTQLGEGQTMEETEDGGMIVKGIDTIIPNLYYNISAVYDHTLTINGESISLKELCGEERNIQLCYEP